MRCCCTKCAPCNSWAALVVVNSISFISLSLSVFLSFPLYCIAVSLLVDFSLIGCRIVCALLSISIQYSWHLHFSVRPSVCQAVPFRWRLHLVCGINFLGRLSILLIHSCIFFLLATLSTSLSLSLSTEICNSISFPSEEKCLSRLHLPLLIFTGNGLRCTCI